VHLIIVLLFLSFCSLVEKNYFHHGFGFITNSGGSHPSADTSKGCCCLKWAQDCRSWTTRDVEVLMRSMVSTCAHVGARYYPHPCLGVTRGDHVSWPTMENMIPTMMMINMSTNSITTTPLIHLYSYRSTEAHHMQATQVWEMVSDHHHEVC
jgi:hypothetical protein